MGIRNKVLVIYTVEYVSFATREIIRLAGDPETEVAGFSGCTDNEYTVRFLITLIRHPNIGAVLTVGLGCGYMQSEWLADVAGKEGEEAVWMFIQRGDRTRRTTKKSLAVMGLMRERLKDTKREPMGIRGLIIGIEYGGFDYTSGLAGNVVVERFFDRLTDLGGAAIFEEIVEVIGLEEMLVGRVTNGRARQEIGDTYDKALECCKSVRQYSISPGNFAGELPAIEEKGMGAPIRSGSRPIEGVLKVGVKPPHPGLWLLDPTPNPYWIQFGIINPNDNEGLMGLAACRSHTAFLVTGRGSVVGFTVVPCIKITGDSTTYRTMEKNMDFDIGPVLEGRCSQDEVVQRLLRMVAEVASGTKSGSEALGHEEYFILYKHQDRDVMEEYRGVQAMFDIGSCFLSEGQTTIVTSDATGLGLAITRCMAGAGAKMTMLSYKSRGQGREALKEFRGKTMFYRFGITDTDHTQEMMDRVITEQGPVTVLANNVGNHCRKYIEDMTVEDYVNVLNIHLMGASALVKALFPHIKEQGERSILFQASMTSYIGQPQVTGYATTKAGYPDLVHTLAAEDDPYGMRVSAIAPGWTDTPTFHKTTNGSQVRLGRILGRILIQRAGSVTDIGMAAVFLSSDTAGYISGTCLPVDGGVLIGF